MTKPAKPSKPARVPKEVVSSHAGSFSPVVEEDIVVDSSDKLNTIASDNHLEDQSMVPVDSVISVAVDMSIWCWNARPDTPDRQDIDSLFSYAVRGLVDRMLPSIMLVDMHVSNDGELSFDCDREPIAPPIDRHGAKLVHKKVKRRKQHYATSIKTSRRGSYAASRASSRTASRFGGSRFGGSLAPTTSVRSTALTAKIAKLAFPSGSSTGTDPRQDSSWFGSQQGSTNNNSNGNNSSAYWSQSVLQSGSGASAPSSVAGTARMRVDFAEIERRAEIERDIHTRESVKHSTNATTRRGELRLKLRSLADPTISVEKEEALAALATKAEGSRRQSSRQATRGKTSGVSMPALSPLSIKPRDPPVCSRTPAPAINPEDEDITYRTEDYEGLTSDVVLQDKSGELLVGENCFLVARKPRQELLLDLQMQSSVEPWVKLLPTPRKEEDTSISVVDSSTRNVASRQSRSRGSPARGARQNSPEGPSTFKANAFGGQTGSFESLPSFTIDPKTTRLAKGVALKLIETPAAQPSPSRAPPKENKKSLAQPTIQESIPNAKLEKDLDLLLKAAPKTKSAVRTSLSDPVPHHQNTNAAPVHIPGVSSPSLAPSSSFKTFGAEYPVLPKNIHNGDKDLPSSRIRTPACPNRLSRKASSRSSLREDLTNGSTVNWGHESTDNLFSLHEQYKPPASLPKVKYRREFPSPPPGRIRLFGPPTLETDWTLPAPSPFPFASMSATIKGKR